MEAAGCSVTAACDRMQLIMCQREVVRLSHIYIYICQLAVSLSMREDAWGVCVVRVWRIYFVDRGCLPGLIIHVEWWTIHVINYWRTLELLTSSYWHRASSKNILPHPQYSNQPSNKLDAIPSVKIKKECDMYIIVQRICILYIQIRHIRMWGCFFLT